MVTYVAYVYGASYCSPCQSIKNYIEANGFQDMSGVYATYQDIQQPFAQGVPTYSLLSNHFGLTGFSSGTFLIPAVVIFKIENNETTVLAHQFGGVSAQWIREQINADMSGLPVSNEGSIEDSILIDARQTLGLQRDTFDMFLIASIILFLLGLGFIYTKK